MKPRHLSEALKQIQEAHERKEERYLKLFKMCLRHIKPEQVKPWQVLELRKQRNDLIEAITHLIQEKEKQNELA